MGLVNDNAFVIFFNWKTCIENCLELNPNLIKSLMNLKNVNSRQTCSFDAEILLLSKAYELPILAVVLQTSEFFVVEESDFRLHGGRLHHRAHDEGQVGSKAGSENLADPGPGADHVGDLRIVVGQIHFAGLRFDQHLHHFGRVRRELLCSDGESDERDALDGLASQQAELGCVRIQDHVFQTRNKPKFNETVIRCLFVI